MAVAVPRPVSPVYTKLSNYDSAQALLITVKEKASGEPKEILAGYIKTLENDNSKLLKQSDIAAKENRVREFTDKGKNIDDETLKFSSLNEADTRTILDDYNTMSEYIKK